MASAARPIGAPAVSKSRRTAKPVEYNILLTATLCLLAAGAVMVYSASSARTLLAGQGDGTSYLVKYVGYGAVGLVAMQLLTHFRLDALRRITAPLLITSFVLLLAVKVPGLGVEINGGRRWLGAGPLQFQPSELMKLALVLYAATVLATTPSRLRSFHGATKPLLLVTGGAIALIASQPDLGTALVIAFTIGALLLVAGVPLGLIGRIAGIAGVVLLLFILVEPYRAARLTGFLDPWAHAHTAIGFQSVQGQIAVGSGGFLGVGIGQSVQKIFYLPEAQTDFILAIIGEELGIAGICGLLFLYGLIGYAGLRTAKAATTRYAQLLAAGLTALILCQALLNVFAVLGMAPITGVPLPFISAGSSSLLVMLATMGLLMNVASRSESHLAALPHPASDHDDARGSRRAESGDRGGRDGRTRRAGSGGRGAAEGRRR
ncbi:MAG TPA: putative lipid II flippase FtsW [Solirubrobacteraceae bacterium]|jgi:cell division protein FtsW|nr:putative lipid II flippase FtsW [Solirubrobacteraceae bacterium]